MQKSLTNASKSSDDGTPDRDSFLDRLEHGIARLQAGDLSALAPALPPGLNKEVALELGEIVTQIAEAAAISTMAEAAIVAACHGAGMEAVMLEACRRRGIRKGRRAFAVAMRDYLAHHPLVPSEESSGTKE